MDAFPFLFIVSLVLMKSTSLAAQETEPYYSSREWEHHR